MSPLDKVDLAGGAPKAPPVLVLSSVFPGKVCCRMCGLPVPPEQIKDVKRGLCHMCAADVAQVAIAIASDDRTILPRTPPMFDKVIKDLRDTSGPAIVGTAEALLQELGGEQQLGIRIAQDLKRARLEHLSEDVRKFHEPDLKLVKQMHELVVGILEKRDERLKGQNEDPMGDMDEESLMALITQASELRLASDRVFREQMLLMIYDMDRSLYETVQAHKLTAGIVRLPSQEEQPTVLVVEPKDEHGPA